MKIVLTFILILTSCRTDKPSNANQLTNQQGSIHLETCSRGCYQFILQPAGAATQRFYVTNFPDSLTTFVLNAHNNQKDLRVFFSGKQLSDKQMVQSAGPNDRLTPLYELPSFQLERIRRQPAKPTD